MREPTHLEFKPLVFSLSSLYRAPHSGSQHCAQQQRAAHAPSASAGPGQACSKSSRTPRKRRRTEGAERRPCAQPPPQNDVDLALREEGADEAANLFVHAAARAPAPAPHGTTAGQQTPNLRDNGVFLVEFVGAVRGRWLVQKSLKAGGLRRVDAGGTGR